MEINEIKKYVTVSEDSDGYSALLCKNEIMKCGYMLRVGSSGAVCGVTGVAVWASGQNKIQFDRRVLSQGCDCLKKGEVMLIQNANHD